MDKRFLEAFLTPKRKTMLGYDLKPFCLKHRIQLAALESPFALGGAVTAFDVIIFCKVCSERPFAFSLSMKEKFYAFRLKKVSYMVEAVESAKSHMRSDAWPQFWQKDDQGEGDARMSGVPWALSTIANLVKNGVSHDEAIHLPEAYAMWLSTTLSVQDGAKVDILTTEDEALFDELAKVEKP